MKYLIEAVEAAQERLLNDCLADQSALTFRESPEYGALCRAIARAKSEKAIESAKHDLPAQYIDRAHALICKEWKK